MRQCLACGEVDPVAADCETHYVTRHHGGCDGSCADGLCPEWLACGDLVRVEAPLDAGALEQVRLARERLLSQPPSLSITDDLIGDPSDFTQFLTQVHANCRCALFPISPLLPTYPIDADP